MLSRLPRLRELSLHSLEIDSLAILAQPPLTNQLTFEACENATAALFFLGSAPPPPDSRARLLVRHTAFV